MRSRRPSETTHRAGRPLRAVATAAVGLFVVCAAPAFRAEQAQTASPSFGFHHVHMNVADPLRSIAYYTDMFATTRKAAAGGWDALQSENAYILFDKVAKPASAELDTGLWHFGWNSPDLIPDYKKLEARGFKFFRTPPSSAHIFTLDGNDVEMVQGTGTSGGSATYAFNHVHLQSAAPLCTAQWYRRVLGLRLAPRGKDPDSVGDCHVPFSGRSEPGNVIREPNTQLLMDDIVLFISPNQNPAKTLVSSRGRLIDHLALATTDVPAALDRARAHGVKVLRDVHNFGNTRLKAAMIEGPDAVAIELVERPVTTAPKKKVLFLTHTAHTFTHPSLGPAERAVAELGERGGFTVTALEGHKQARDKIDLSFISPSYLAQFDALLMMTNGELPLTDSQRAALVDFVRGGKGFVALHCTPATLFTYPPFGHLVGGYFLRTFNSINGPEMRPVVLKIEDRNHPATRMFTERWTVADEYYQFAPAPWDPLKPDENVANGQRIPIGFSRDRVHVLLSFDSERTDMSGRPNWVRGGDYPQAWYQNVGKGRSFYTSLGHRDELWTSDALFRAHLVGGIRWALGLEN